MICYSAMHPFTDKLLIWFDEHQRPLPWRENPDPYSIWLSEIILQQTRVDQGLAYYANFKEAYPSVHDLAKAREDEVLKLWQGLGYYSRARNLLKAAQQVVNEFDGRFPDSAKALEKLKGVGPYTSAAIASIAFNEAIPVVDGNVQRVMARILNEATPVNKPDGHERIRSAMESFLPTNRPGDFNQSVMELGALVCSPRNPKCDECPVKAHCAAYKAGTVANLPVKEKKTKVREVFFDYAVFVSNDRTILRFRAEKGIWQNMYDFPCIEHEKQPNVTDATAQLLAEHNTDATLREVFGPIKHLLSHRRIQARFFVFDCTKLPDTNRSDYKPVTFNAVSQYAVPRLVEKFLNEHLRIDLFSL